LKTSILFLTLSFLLCSQKNFAQENYKSPKKAAILSIIPGGGQVYTKKYWKVPIIYSALFASGYYIIDNNKNYKHYRDTYLNRINGIGDDYPDSNSQLITKKDYYKRNREISIMLFSLAYILNIVDASVNAHLFQYDIDENISLKIEPFSYDRFNHNLICLKINL
tara:strand:- start:481 stop:975 length:495 start_codon:yes stop_codon:yes gene_type:complete